MDKREEESELKLNFEGVIRFARIPRTIANEAPKFRDP
jgi:hypothetical protein